jgi:hypothetical protein
MVVRNFSLLLFFRGTRVYSTFFQNYSVDNILNTKQPHYDTIKKYYPHYFHKVSKDG